MFYGSIWLGNRRFGFFIACFWGPIGGRISLCFWPGGIDLSNYGAACGGVFLYPFPPAGYFPFAGEEPVGRAASIDGGSGRGGCENSEG